jgi:hypothetical protein
VAQFLVEAYVSAADPIGQAETIARLQAAATELTAADLSVRYVRSIFVPDDEVCFHVFEASSADTVEQVGRRAQLTFDRVTEAMEPVV